MTITPVTPGRQNHAASNFLVCSQEMMSSTGLPRSLLNAKIDITAETFEISARGHVTSLMTSSHLVVTSYDVTIVAIWPCRRWQNRLLQGTLRSKGQDGAERVYNVTCSFWESLFGSRCPSSCFGACCQLKIPLLQPTYPEQNLPFSSISPVHLLDP